MCGWVAVETEAKDLCPDRSVLTLRNLWGSLGRCVEWWLWEIEAKDLREYVTDN